MVVGAQQNSDYLTPSELRWRLSKWNPDERGYDLLIACLRTMDRQLETIQTLRSSLQASAMGQNPDTAVVIRKQTRYYVDARRTNHELGCESGRCGMCNCVSLREERTRDMVRRIGTKYMESRNPEKRAAGRFIITALQDHLRGRRE